ncbi:MAG: carboxymuconolactone decarboxylase family protein, partial [Dehalococcoidia bacterium]|nr:carboxymuconolactone decarboxylase family protein [Dehalococcoidia bacterium]
MVEGRGSPVSKMVKPRFYKKTYRHPGEFLADIFFLTKNSGRIRRIMKRNLVPNAFRERLMLSVISVYGCRYCCWGHTRAALRSGVMNNEIRSLLAGSVDGCPEDELTALLYARHWADSDMRPEPEAAESLEQTYGKEKAEAINFMLRMIRVGNLSGNSWDRFLNLISFGKLAKTSQAY